MPGQLDVCDSGCRVSDSTADDKLCDKDRERTEGVVDIGDAATTVNEKMNISIDWANSATVLGTSRPSTERIACC